MNNQLTDITRMFIVTCLLLLILSGIAMAMIPTLKPIKTFTQYYLCRITAALKIGATDCNTLATVIIAAPKLTDMRAIGADDPKGLQLFFSNHNIAENIYAHRTNSPERAKIYKKYYTAFEFDAIWDDTKNAIDIFHWPEHSSIDFHLNELLEILPKKSQLWLDLKNLTEGNRHDITNYLKALFRKQQGFNQTDIIIESKNVQSVSVLATQGFITSYYLPAIDYKDNCANISITKTIAQHINRFPTRYISFPYEQQAYVDNCLLPLTGELAQLSWGGLPYAIPSGATNRYHAYIVDHAIQ